MNIDEIKKVFNENKQQMSNLLKNCENTSSELELLNLKMGKLLKDLNTMEDSLFERMEAQEEHPTNTREFHPTDPD